MLDKNCVPISDAKIQIWQANHYGLYQYSTPISKNNDIKSKDFFDPNFVGSGTAVTNNMGQFNFLSIMPGEYEDNKPHININIIHPDFDDFQTEMFFSDVIGNMSDINLKKIPANERYKLISISKTDSSFHQNQEENQENFNNIYLFDIVIDIEISNKQY